MAIKDAYSLMNYTEEKKILINGSKISFYSNRILLTNEIDFSSIKKSEVTIKTLYLMKNGKFICTSKEGDIFIFKINRREFEVIKIIFLMKKKCIKLKIFYKIIFVCYQKIIFNIVKNRLWLFSPLTDLFLLKINILHYNKICLVLNKLFFMFFKFFLFKKKIKNQIH